MKKLYSYIRWSSAQQTAGTSLERQTTAAREYASSHNLEFVEILDAGVSAFKGKNATEGALADFITAVKAGVIPADATLFVENLDRLSRQDVLTANRLFIELLMLGLTIVTGQDNRIYTQESVADNPTDLMISILYFARANEESKTKSERVRDASLKALARFQAGLPTTIKGGGADPFWIQRGGRETSPTQHPTHWLAIKKIVELSLQGIGCNRIRQVLNADPTLYPPPRQKDTPQRRALIDAGLAPTGWNIHRIEDARRQPSLYGLKTIKLSGHTYNLEGYYPAVCSEEEFHLIQNISANNRKKSGDIRNAITLLSGLNLCKCGSCGGWVTTFRKNGKLTYRCDAGHRKIHHCTTTWSLNALIIESSTIRALIAGVAHNIIEDSQDLESVAGEIDNRRAEVLEIDRKRERLAIRIAEEDDDLLMQQLRQYNARKRDLLTEIGALTQREALRKEGQNVAERLAEALRLLTADMVNDIFTSDRLAVRELIRKSMRQVTIWKRQDKSLKVECEFISGWRYTFEGVINGGQKSFIEYRTSPDGRNMLKIYDKLNTITAKVFARVLGADAVAMVPTLSHIQAYHDMAVRLGHSPLTGSQFFWK
ncbi:recombinase family protein [Enterobacter roggenkampii]|uniref:recombinase family protein n=1 Tax=Enterobacter roggenkampii TaxID=1812935 RepID=UPI0011BA12A7|nr:recombinase family protein [Enterobacter roggenkampii]TWY18176.1 recombinase family protein [Enterobacter roggenkampii]